MYHVPPVNYHTTFLVAAFRIWQGVPKSGCNDFPERGGMWDSTEGPPPTKHSKFISAYQRAKNLITA
jgi:hypothetical protein